MNFVRPKNEFCTTKLLVLSVWWLAKNLKNTNHSTTASVMKKVIVKIFPEFPTDKRVLLLQSSLLILPEMPNTKNFQWKKYGDPFNVLTDHHSSI